MGIAIRQCADFARDRRLRRETSLDEARNSVSGVTPSSAFDTRDLRGLLSRVIQHLPSRQRAVFILFAHEGRTLDEIAETLNCSVGTVKTHLHRARQRLRRELQHVIKGGETDYLSTGTTRAERTARRACPSTL